MEQFYIITIPSFQPQAFEYREETRQPDGDRWENNMERDCKRKLYTSQFQRS